jgi:hypothetical protein
MHNTTIQNYTIHENDIITKQGNLYKINGFLCRKI